MKSQMKKIYAVLLCVMLVLSLVACGASTQTKTQAVQTDPAVQAYIDEVSENLPTDNGNMKLKLEARGNDMVFMYTYTIDLPSNIRENLKSTTEVLSSALESSAKAIRKEEPKIERVIYEYYSKDGDFLYSESY